MFSFDCFVATKSVESDTNFTYSLKAILAMLSPILIFALYVIIWGILVAIKKATEYKNKLIVSGVTILFLLHPSLMFISLSMFNCEVVEDESYFKDNMDIVCWSVSHFTSVIPIGLTIIFIWVIGFPLFSFFLLKRN